MRHYQSVRTGHISPYIYQGYLLTSFLYPDIIVSQIKLR
jgi:hypothetical protein